MISELKISSKDIKLIKAEFESNKPYEACGVFIGTIKNGTAYVEKALPINNIKRSNISFELDPKEHYMAWNDADKNDKEVVGVYHTHPAWSAVPSSWDRKTMESSPSVWLIVGIDGMMAYVWDEMINNVKIISIEIIERQNEKKIEKIIENNDNEII